MRTLPRNEWPIWIKGRLKGKKNVEVKEHNNKFYLYEYQNVWDKRKKCPLKTTKYSGVLREKESFRVLEQGHVALLMRMAKQPVLSGLQKHFLEDWRYLAAFAMNRVVYPMPLKRLDSWFEKTSLPSMLNLERVTPKTMSKVLERVGVNFSGQADFMKELSADNELLLYDGSVVYSHAKNNKLLEVGYNKDKLLLPKANITLLFSKTRNIPIYFKLFFGSVHEINTVKTVIDELRGRKVIFVADKGYYKNKLFEDLHTNSINFIIPLPRDDKRIDYSKNLSKFMEYRGRIINYARYKKGKFFVYVFQDQFLKYNEITEYYKIKLAGKRAVFHEEWAGKISILSNVDENPQEVYSMYKTRDSIEKAFHVLQNILDLDTPYVSKEGVFKGYVFATFVAMILYYKVLNLLKQKGLNKKLSVEDLMFELSKVMINEQTGAMMECPKRTRKIVEQAGLTNIITKNG